MKPSTIKAAFDYGYAIGNDTSGMLGLNSTWPTEADWVKPDAFVRAWSAGWTAGHSERRDGMPAWACDDGDYQRSDAAPNL